MKLTSVVLGVILMTTLSSASEPGMHLNEGWNLVSANVDINGGVLPEDEILEDTLVHFPKPRRTGVDMSIFIGSLDGIRVIEGAELGCLTEAGLVAGAKALDPNQDRWGMAAWGDDAWTEEVDGFEYDETLTFLYWDPLYEEELEVEVDVVEGHGLTFRPGEILNLGMHVSVDETDVILPAEFSLSSIHPNPFNSEAKFSYTLNRPGTVNLKMYDLNGRLIRSLFEGWSSTGSYTATIDGEHLHSGMYLIILDLDGEKRSIRAVLLK